MIHLHVEATVKMNKGKKTYSDKLLNKKKQNSDVDTKKCISEKKQQLICICICMYNKLVSYVGIGKFLITAFKISVVL